MRAARPMEVRHRGGLKGTQGPRLGCREGAEFQSFSFALLTSRVPLQQAGRETEKLGN
jgi:hypothetical protein